MSSCPNVSKTLNCQSYLPKKTVGQLLLELQNPRQLPIKPYSTRPQLDVNMIRSQMKKKWKDPGYGNIQFIKPPVLKAKLLSEWQYERIYQAQRSYKFPKNFKGIKFDRHSRQFDEPDSNMLPHKFTQYLKKIKTQSQEKMFAPDKTMSLKKQRIMRMLTENATISSTNRQFRKSGFFGYSMNKKMKTKSNF